MIEPFSIIQLGNPLLRNSSKSVRSIKTRSIQILIDDLIAMVKAVDGVGISAPQAGISKRVIIIASHPNKRYPKAPTVTPFAMINPMITAHSFEKEKDWEGCLSIPGIRGLVPRHTRITVEYKDRKMKTHIKAFTNFIARIIQHECDHLDGVVFLDRLDSTKDIVTEVEYHKQFPQ